jgi:hypothetical protein
VAAAFPIGLSQGPPLGSKTPAGRDGLDEVVSNGVTFIRTGIPDWRAEFLEGQIAQQRTLHAAAADRGLSAWLWLGDLPDVPGPSGAGNERMLARVVDAFKGDRALLAWKGYDEPRNPFRGANWIRPAGLQRAHATIKALDPVHPVVIIQAPRNSVAELTPYRPAFDITGVDVYPVSYPPGIHTGGRNRDINVVGEVTRKIRAASGGKPFWVTLQIAWSGVAPSREHPDVVPRVPSLHQERFMAYQAIANGARGLVFFGGHLRQVMTPQDAASGWNWTFWRRVLRPLTSELGSAELHPALAVADAPSQVAPHPADPQIELVTRRTTTHLYVIAVKTGGPVKQVTLGGLPRGLTTGEVLFEYVQQPLPPPVTGHQAARPVRVHSGAFSDWFAPHDVHVYRFPLMPRR